MSKSLRTLIEWAHFTLNFWWGCTKVSPACAHCYAETLARVFSRGQATWGPAGARWLRFDSAANKLPKIVRAAGREKFRPRVFVNSMSDTFESNPVLDETRRKMLALLAANTTCDFLLLTKRPENIRGMVPTDWLNWHWPAHVWIGTTVENQATAEERIPLLLGVPAAVRFLSCEPLLGRVNLLSDELLHAYPYHAMCQGLHWVIAGGESGAGARPTQAQWVRDLRDDCTGYGTKFFFKQWGEWLPFDHCKYVGHTMPLVDAMNHGQSGAPVRLGKKKSGRILDGREWNEIPEGTRE